MNEIICPHCSKAFKIDETGYADIVRQVHDAKFEQALHERVAASKDAEISALKAKLDAVGVEKQLVVSEVQKQRQLCWKRRSRNHRKQVWLVSMRLVNGRHGRFSCDSALVENVDQEPVSSRNRASFRFEPSPK